MPCNAASSSSTTSRRSTSPTRTMVGVEALLRWHHPKHGMVPPDRFIPLAEDTGLILPIGAWVLEQACSQASRWQRAGLPQLRISVNLSPVQFRDPDLAGVVRSALERSTLAPDCLELEITERTLMEDTETNLAILRDLKQLGVKISIDDFGVGHSSLGYLRRFAFDEIKLDRSFVAALEHDPSAAAIVRATLSLGRSLGLDAVAEGVESAEQLAMLDAEGCRLAQGYYFSPPVHVQEIDSHGQGAGRGQAGCRRSERLTGWPRGCSAAQALLAGAGNHFQPAGAVAGDRRGGVRDGAGIGGAVGQRGAETDGPADGWLGAGRPCQPADAVPGSRRGRRQARALAADSARVDRCGGGCGVVVGNAGRCPASAPAGRPAVVTRLVPRRSSPRRRDARQPLQPLADGDAAIGWPVHQK